MNFSFARFAGHRGTSTLGVLVALIGLAVGCGADAAAEIDASSHDDGDVDAAAMPPDLEVAWIRTRQREGGPEYAFAPDPRGGWLAFQPHAEHQLRVVGDAVVFGDTAAPAQLRVGAIGRAVEAEVPSFDAVPPADVTVTGNRAARAFGGSEVWYLNGPLGLEQGLTLDRRTAGEGELVVRVDVSGGQVVPLRESDEAESDTHTVREIEVRSGDVAVRYHTIFATDATGARLPAHLEARGETIELHVDDSDATYPLEIDPLVVTVQKLTSSSWSGYDLAGFAVAISGTVAVVGAPLDDDKGDYAGAAYVFFYNGSVWSQVAKLVAPDGAATDRFGYSVAVTGAFIAVGAPHDDSNKGAVYIWSGGGSSWTYQTKIVPATAVAGDHVGWSVGLDTDTMTMVTTLVAGAPFDDETPGVNCGAVYVFTRGSSWTQQAKLAPSGLAAGDQLGLSVAVSLNRLVAGAPFAAAGSPLATAAGKVYAYSRSGTTWTAAAAPLVASDAASGANDNFGSAVAINGTSAIIGAPYNDDTATNSGSAYVFVFGTSWTQQRKFVASDPIASRLFGFTVGIFGNHAVVGSNIAANGAYVSFRTGTTWPTNMTKILGSDSAAGDVFGRVAISGTTLVVGAPYDAWTVPGTTIEAGSGYAFAYGSSWTQQGILRATDGSHDDRMGTSVFVDGSTAIIGAPGDDDAGLDTGAVYIFVKSGGAWSLQQKILSNGGTTTENFGFDVAVSGDVAVIGAPSADDTFTNSGAVYLFTRAAGVWTKTLRIKRASTTLNEYFGWAVAVDGNTFAASAPLADTASVDSGTIVVYDKPAATWTLRSTLVGAGGATLDQNGYSLALEGDRLASGAPFNDTGGANAGAVFMYSRPSFGSVWGQFAIVAPTDTIRAGDNVGWDVAYAGGVLIAGAPGDTEKGAAAGAAFTFMGPSTFTPIAKITAGDGAANDLFGTSVAISGPVVAVGAPGDDTGRGGAYAYQLAGGTWVTLQNKVVASDGAANHAFGYAVALDVRELLIGARHLSHYDFRSGGVYAHFVNGFAGDPCGSAASCGTGFCVDGVCCNSACGGTVTTDCQACSFTAGAAVNGTCSALNAAGAPTVVCRASVGVCDVADVCVPSSTSCPADAKYSAATVCRTPVDLCDAPDMCDGTNNACPADLKLPTSHECRAAAMGVLCDKPEYCAGGNACPADVPYSIGDNHPCRSSAGLCDIVETCTGAFTCPADVFAFGNVCRMAMGVCDIAETCAGTSAACPADSFAPASTECRAVAGDCDVAELCTGSAAACPTDAFVDNTMICRGSAGDCDPQEQCTGASAMCPTDVLRNSAHVCRAALPTPTCDQAENCTGSAVSCPADIALPVGSPCRPAGADCDIADVCDGIALSCADDTLSSTCEQQNVSIGPGRYHTCAVRADGKLYCWGDNTFGQLGIGTTTAALVPTRVGVLTNWKTVTAGAFHTCATNTAGAVYCWGRNDRGQAGQTASATPVTAPVAVGAFATATALALGDFHSCALAGTGVWCWGGNAFGQLGRGTLVDSNVPMGVSGMYTQLATGANHSCAMTSLGAVSCWGANATGQLGADPSVTMWSAVPVAVSALPTTMSERPIGVAAGGPRTCVIYRGQRVMCWGSNAARRAGDTLGYSSTPLDMALTGVASITLGESHICTRELDGDVACWGDNSFGQLGDLTATSRWLLPASAVATTRDIVSLIAGPMQTCAVVLPVGGETTAPIICWGRGEEGQLGVGNDLDRVRMAERVNWPDPSLPAQVAGGWSHTCATSDAGAVYCWGDARYGATGPGLSEGVRYTPAAVGVSTAVKLVSGDGFSCALSSSQEVFCWGRNDRGQVAQPACVGDACPTAMVAGVSSIESIAAGRAHVCVVGLMGADTANKIYCWGANGEGQLGDGTFIDRRTPTLIPLPYEAREVVAGESHTCAIAEQSAGVNHVYCWGRNSEGQVGDTTFTGDSIPYVPPPDTLDAGIDFGAPPLPEISYSRRTPQHHAGTIVDPIIVAGRSHTCTVAILGSALQLNCWGKNTYGELGDGTRVHRAIPVVSSVSATLTGLFSFASGEAFTCLGGGASLGYCWGRNDASQLGDRTTTDSPTAAVTVLGVTAVSEVGAGLAHGCAISGSAAPGVYCWGRNEYGQVGNLGFRANRVAPVTVPVP